MIQSLKFNLDDAMILHYEYVINISKSVTISMQEV